jgi:hypothetical protein
MNFNLHFPSVVNTGAVLDHILAIGKNTFFCPK